MDYLKLSCRGLLLITCVASNTISAYPLLNNIQPTGYWYTAAHYDYTHIDGCLLPTPRNTIQYEGLSPSFTSAKNGYFNKNYRGGQCSETITDVTEKSPDDWPIPYAWDIYQEQFSGSPSPKLVEFTCHEIDGYGVYSFSSIIQPQYQCLDGTCNQYKKACAGDVYAGDLLQFPAELLGHTGIIYTSDDPNPEQSYLVMEVLNTPPIIHTDLSLNDIQKERPVWGIRYGYGKLDSMGEMSFLDAVTMATLGLIQGQYCPQYTLKPIYKLGGVFTQSITNPMNHQTKEIITTRCAVFRCDTFVKYLYKAVLHTDLPPRDALQAPKDLFNAFPNQRGEIIKAISSLNPTNTGDDTFSNVSDHHLWSTYQNPKNSLSKRSMCLDSITELHAIQFPTLINAIATEKDNELKSKLLYMAFEKIKGEQLNKTEWEDLKKITLNLLRDSSDPKILVNALILSELILTPKEMTFEIKTLLSKNAGKYSAQEAIMMNNAIHLALFTTMINSDSITLHQTIANILNTMSRDSVTESFAVYINDTPKDKLSPIRQYLHDYIAKTRAAYFHTNVFFKNNYRAKLWSSALLKVKDPSISPTDEIYQRLIHLNDRFVRSLIIIENKNIIATPEDKLKFLKLLNQTHLFKPHDDSPIDKITMNQATLFLNNKEL